MNYYKPAFLLQERQTERRKTWTHRGRTQIALLNTSNIILDNTHTRTHACTHTHTWVCREFSSKIHEGCWLPENSAIVNNHKSSALTETYASSRSRRVLALILQTNTHTHTRFHKAFTNHSKQHSEGKHWGQTEHFQVILNPTDNHSSAFPIVKFIYNYLLNIKG